MAQVKSLNCPNCGDSIPDTSKACPSCGSRVILSDDRQKFVLAGTICPKCGLDNKEQHRFCSKCGDKLFKECPKCHKEIGLDSLHCPFCGDNIDNAAKERETELAKYKDCLSQVELLQQKLKLLTDERDKQIQQIDSIPMRIDYNKSDWMAWHMFFVVYPIGALIISGIVYWMGLKSFVFAFIASYAGIFLVFHRLPSMEYKKISSQTCLLIDEIRGIQNEIDKHNQVIYDVKSKYQI